MIFKAVKEVTYRQYSSQGLRTKTKLANAPEVRHSVYIDVISEEFEIPEDMALALRDFFCAFCGYKIASKKHPLSFKLRSREPAIMHGYTIMYADEHLLLAKDGQMYQTRTKPFKRWGKNPYAISVRVWRYN